MGGKKKDPTHGMAQVASPEEIREALRPAGISSRARLIPQSTQEQIDFLRGELGRTKRRVRDLEAQARTHGHPELEAPPLRNGMYIDEPGEYWMRRPDGWHYCYVLDSVEHRPGGQHDRPVYPVQRLAEPKGEGPLR